MKGVPVTTRILAAALACVVTFALGCATLDATIDPRNRRSDLEDQQRRYTQFVRWGELDAASALVATDAREAFAKVMPRLAQMRFTDHEQGDIEWSEDGLTATVRVTYLGYPRTTLVERPMVETQKWIRDEEADGWRVEPDWSELRASLGPARP
jgi:hypothetical protein